MRKIQTNARANKYAVKKENPHFCGFLDWWRRRGSNPRPKAYESFALPTELPRPLFGIEWPKVYQNRRAKVNTAWARNVWPVSEHRNADTVRQEPPDARGRGWGFGRMIPLSLRSSKKLGGATSIFSAVHFAFSRTSLTTAKCQLRKSGRSPAFSTVPSGPNLHPRPLTSELTFN